MHADDPKLNALIGAAATRLHLKSHTGTRLRASVGSSHVILICRVQSVALS